MTCCFPWRLLILTLISSMYLSLLMFVVQSLCTLLLYTFFCTMYMLQTAFISCSHFFGKKKLCKWLYDAALGKCVHSWPGFKTLAYHTDTTNRATAATHSGSSRIWILKLPVYNASTLQTELPWPPEQPQIDGGLKIIPC